MGGSSKLSGIARVAEEIGGDWGAQADRARRELPSSRPSRDFGRVNLKLRFETLVAPKNGTKWKFDTNVGLRRNIRPAF